MFSDNVEEDQYNINTQFTEFSIVTTQNSLMKNDSTRSVILCPFNSANNIKSILDDIDHDLIEEKDIMIRFHVRVRERDREYEKYNNQDFDNGVYHKYAYN